MMHCGEGCGSERNVRKTFNCTSKKGQNQIEGLHKGNHS